ncbi:MAG TPA: hypothetical protein VFE14_20995 [Micromonosporaceae bacterium]|nr:hypothetical protein [Micromonosporaceae bacterium]
MGGFTNPIESVAYGTVDSPVLLASETIKSLAANFTYLSPTIDLRPFESYGLVVRLEDGTMNTTDIIGVDLSFYAEPLLSADSLIFVDYFEVLKTNILGSSVFRLSDVVHGPYLKMTIFDPNVVGRTVVLTYRLYGSYRPLANTFLRTAADGVLYQTRSVLGAGANNGGSAARLGYGRGLAVLVSGAGGGATMDIRYSNSTIVDEQLVAAAANTRISKELVLPRDQAVVTITNNGAAGSTIDAYILQQISPF